MYFLVTSTARSSQQPGRGASETLSTSMTIERTAHKVRPYLSRRRRHPVPPWHLHFDVHHLWSRHFGSRIYQRSGDDLSMGGGMYGAWTEGLSPRSEVGLRLALLAALKLALDDLGVFVFRPCASS